MSTQNPVLSAPVGDATLNLGSSRLIRRISSQETDGALAVVEFISAPGEGVAPHVHQHEDELVYLLEGQIDVTVGSDTVTVPQGACALLPRGIAHGFVNSGNGPSRLMAVLLPGRLDQFFVALDRELSIDRPHEDAIDSLCNRFGVRFVPPARA